jgi:hypothetical protein
MSPAGFEHAIPTTKNPHIHALDRTALDPSLFTLMCNLPPFISRLSTGSPLIALSMTIQLNTRVVFLLMIRSNAECLVELVLLL